jgi:hypothetical protein
MGYSVVQMFFKDGNFYFSNPGTKVYCTRDDHGVFRYNDFIFRPQLTHPLGSYAISRSETIRYVNN